MPRNFKGNGAPQTGIRSCLNVTAWRASWFCESVKVSCQNFVPRSTAVAIFMLLWKERKMSGIIQQNTRFLVTLVTSRFFVSGNNEKYKAYVMLFCYMK